MTANDIPVTPEFMESLGFSDDSVTRNLKRYEICGPAVRVIFDACAGPERWRPLLIVSGHLALPRPTQDRIRRLAEALYHPTDKPPAAGEE